jgi:hypothetical protein
MIETRSQYTPEDSDPIWPQKQIMTVPLSSVSYAPILLRVELKDSAVEFISRVSGAVLQDLKFCASKSSSCGQPKLGSARWYLHGSLYNPGTAVGKYTVTVRDRPSRVPVTRARADSRRAAAQSAMSPASSRLHPLSSSPRRQPTLTPTPFSQLRAYQMQCTVPVLSHGELNYGALPKDTVDLGKIPVIFTSLGTPEWLQQLMDGNCTLVLQDEQVGNRTRQIRKRGVRNRQRDGLPDMCSF